MKYLIILALPLLWGCEKKVECEPFEKIGCICKNGNIYAPKYFSSKERAIEVCADSCLNKNGIARLFCN